MEVVWFYFRHPGSTVALPADDLAVSLSLSLSLWNLICKTEIIFGKEKRRDFIILVGLDDAKVNNVQQNHD